MGLKIGLPLSLLLAIAFQSKLALNPKAIYMKPYIKNNQGNNITII